MLTSEAPVTPKVPLKVPRPRPGDTGGAGRSFSTRGGSAPQLMTIVAECASG